ncbi:MAG: SMP-30/gluconolactonase/LRE family protein [Pseudomonadota bacterium]
MSAERFDARACLLGEGPLWHPERQELFWFDILEKRLLSRKNDVQRDWQFDRYASAAGWLDRDALLVATETDLCRLDLTTDALDPLVPLEAERADTRSNDGRADPFGGFWISTMGKQAQAGYGAIYRFYHGALRQLVSGLTIPNAICFAPDGSHAFYADTLPGKIWRQPLDRHGWPDGVAELFIDHGPGAGPDGAVVDAAGHLWNAHWGHFKVSMYDTAGNALRDYRLPARQPSCPAFGGPELNQLFVTSAREDLGAAATDHDGATYVIQTEARGQAEHRVIL